VAWNELLAFARLALDCSITIPRRALLYALHSTQTRQSDWSLTIAPTADTKAPLCIIALHLDWTTVTPDFASKYCCLQTMALAADCKTTTALFASVYSLRAKIPRILAWTRSAFFSFSDDVSASLSVSAATRRIVSNAFRAFAPLHALCSDIIPAMALWYRLRWASALTAD